MANKAPVRPSTDAPLVYSETARKFHWWTAALVVFMLPLGFAMVDRGSDKIVQVNGQAVTVPGVWDGTTNAMYSAHKLVGFIILWLVAARLYYRIKNGAPASEPGLEKWQLGASHATHWLLYLLLLAVPLGGWIGVSLYGARDVFGLFSLPPIAPVNQALSGTVFTLHAFGAFAILALVGTHISAAIYHHAVRGDGVLRRMWPSLGRKTQD
jgi:cytochrome b561